MCSWSVSRTQGVVLLQPKGPEIRDGAAHKPGNGVRVLEGHRKRPGGGAARGVGGDEEDAGVLPGTGAEGKEDGVGDARVPDGGTRPIIPQGKGVYTTSCGSCTRLLSIRVLVQLQLSASSINEEQLTRAFIGPAAGHACVTNRRKIGSCAESSARRNPPEEEEAPPPSLHEAPSQRPMATTLQQPPLRHYQLSWTPPSHSSRLP
jgi:hypothetical protein